MVRFLRNYVRSMRLYYAFVTGTSVLAGIMMVRTLASDRFLDWRDGAFAAIGFLAWGVNQIFSDWWDREEDAVNAPHRPMVTGELAAKPALALSAALTAVFAAVAAVVSPWALAFLAAGGALNLLYSKTKGVVFLGNAVYATSITMCVLFGMSVMGGRELAGARWRPDVWVFIAWSWYAHFLMCYFSAFKDVEGDRAAGLQTAPVRWGEKRARRVGAFLLTPVLALTALIGLSSFVDALDRGSIYGWGIRVVLLWATLFSAATWWLAFRLLRMVRVRRWHDATRLNCELCVWLQSWPILALYVPIVAWCSIEVLFRSVYRDGQE